ncbi:hypothetical protein HYH03_012260 [Edaphochlamys debaryana]|uniref:Uncharacterized protein n=1 Tax=Edaphochlamys debaryana TaxID=47281 RepID=A0A835XT38_9CHLO|nr:hypothetical protein HYH03_012260 [Edaphochlamys debaryana]|eukprot:KAG2489239.1 hypothetical protein HYH03_012260 [Edaphochlamys debaryana]
MPLPEGHSDRKAAQAAPPASIASLSRALSAVFAATWSTPASAPSFSRPSVSSFAACTAAPRAAFPAARTTLAASCAVRVWTQRHIYGLALGPGPRATAGRDQALAFQDVEGAAAAKYASGLLDLTSSAGVLPNDLPNWSTDPTAAFTVIVIQSLKTQTIDWAANYLIAELSCAAGAPQTSGFLFGTRESFISGHHDGQTAFHTSKPVPVEPGWTMHAFVRRLGGTQGAYYYAGASGGIAVREAFESQLPISIGPDRLTVGTSRCMGSAKSRTQLGAVLVYNRALSVTDLKRVHEAYAPRFGWARGGGGSPVCFPGVNMKGVQDQAYFLALSAADCQTACSTNASCEFSVYSASLGVCGLRRSAINGTMFSNAENPDLTTCFSKPNYGNYYCVPQWEIQGTNLTTLAPMDKSTCLGTCDSDPNCQFAAVAFGPNADCVTKKTIMSGPDGLTQPQPSRGPAFETCIKARVYPLAVECGKWTKGGPGETRTQMDCDGDGILDAVLFDTTGARGVSLSSLGCSTEDEDTGYPNAPESSCPAVFGGMCPKPPGDWCSGGKVLQLDCDADGTKDLACVRKADRTNLQVVRSGRGCFPGAADDFCPPLTANGSCPYPAGSICSQGRMMSVDCNADGVKEWVCLGEAGQLGLVPSWRGCNPALSGYPASALDQTCPIMFGVGNYTRNPAPARPPEPPLRRPPSPSSPLSACPPVPGYAAQQGLEPAADATLGYLTTAAAARAACSARKDCLGFTSAATYFSSLSNTTPSADPSQCLYLKTDTTCPSFGGFHTFVDQDQLGKDYGSPYASLNAVASACNSSFSGCRAFSTTNLTIKTDVGSRTYAHNVCLYYKMTACQSYAGYTTQPDYDHVGDEWQTSSYSPGPTDCNSNLNCAGFTVTLYGWGGSTTSFKTWVSPQTFSYGTCLYIRKPSESACPVLANYTLLANNTGVPTAATINSVSNAAVYVAQQCGYYNEHLEHHRLVRYVPLREKPKR